jgi:cell division septum initiation protein DivIVA
MSQLDEDFEKWAPFLLHLVEVNRLKEENKQLREQIKHLESQVYGGTTK